MNRPRLHTFVSAVTVTVLALALLLSAWQFKTSRASSKTGQDPVADKIDPRLLDALTTLAAAKVKSPTTKASTVVLSIWLRLSEQADLSVAAKLPSKKAKGEYVHQTLREVATRTQKNILSELDRMGLKHRDFWITNSILIDATQAQSSEILRQQITQLANRPDVARLELAERGQSAIEEIPVIPLETTRAKRRATGLSVNAKPRVLAMPVNAPNLQFVRAPEVWASGFNGQGIVVANIDTGVRWDHEALKNNYRGWNGTTANHNYNWWDGIRSGASTDNSCGSASAFPCDDKGHGTHTMGIAVGGSAFDSTDGLDKQIGIAPGAKWVACRAFDQGTTVPGAVESCLQFFLAPTDLNGQNPDPSKAPDIINHSYGVFDNPALRTAFDALTAAGIYNVAAAGNAAFCGSIQTAPENYPGVLTVGALGLNPLLGTPTDNIALFSSKGPGPLGLQKPDLAAPGSNIASADRNGGILHLSGTSQASPLVAGAVALLWSSSPALRHDIVATTELIHRTLRHRLNSQCGSPQPFPNYVYGYGNLDAKATFDNNRSPIPSCQSVTVNNNSCFANASINNGSSDPDGEALTFAQSPAGPYAVGSTLVTLNMTDSRGARNFCQATVTVVESVPPVIGGASASPAVIWPPNNKMVTVAINYTTSDNCSDVTTSLAVSSNEPTTNGDMVVIDEHRVSLRATRLGNGNGRIYTVTITAIDSSGNVSTKQVTVRVPHDQGH